MNNVKIIDDRTAVGTTPKNTGLTIFWVFLVILIIALIAFLIFLFFRYLAMKSNGEITLPNCSSSTANLKNVSSIPCCFNSGINTSFKYDRDTNLTLAPFPSSYQSVCVGFCSQDGYDPTTGTCTGGDVTGFNTCISLMKPRQCLGTAMPIASDGPNLYYGYQAGNSLCSLCCPCGVQYCTPTLC